MAKYVCPECGADGQFTEIFSLLYECTGKFSDVGEVDGLSDCTGSETDRFVCLTCNEEFDKPKKIDEEEKAHRGREGFCAKCNGDCRFTSDGKLINEET